jgi:excisionase family DNA binding protein
VQAAIDAGELKAKKIGAQYRIAKDAIDAYLAGCQFFPISQSLNL